MMRRKRRRKRRRRRVRNGERMASKRMSMQSVVEQGVTRRRNHYLARTT